MLPSVRPTRRAITGAIGTGSRCRRNAFRCRRHRIGRAPPVLEPPPCTAAELARVMSGVTFDTSNYLITHPAVNDFFTSLKGQPKDQIRDQVQTYLDDNPTIRQRPSEHPATLGRLP